MIIIGLGNPGTQYTRTPHNAGHLICDELAARHRCGDWTYEKPMRAYRARCGTWLVIKPWSYMNHAGDALRPLVHDHGVREVARELVVIQDDIDQPLGAIKIVRGRNAGGHNGVTDLINTLQTNQFVRIKIGVAPVDENGVMRKPTGERAVTSYLLAPMGEEKQTALRERARVVDEALVCMDTEGVAKAMSLYNA